MRATIKALQAWVENPPPGANNIFNSRTAHERAKDLLKEAERRRREQQLSRYNAARTDDDELVKSLCEVLDELETALNDTRKGLRRGTAAPREVMGLVAESMKGLRESRTDAQAVDAMADAAAEHVDKHPADFEQEMLDRFPHTPVPWVTDAFLRGEEPSPFEAGGR